MKKVNRECCSFGEFKCDVKVHNFYVDECLADIIKALNDAGIKTVASCCGHQKIESSIVLKDGREISIRKYKERKRMTKEEFKKLVGESIGEASMCWSETPKGVFDSDRAVKIVERILKASEEK